MQDFTWIQVIAVVACALNLTLIATLPTVLFKPGRKHFSWWLTAAPLIVAGVGLSTMVFGVGVWGFTNPIFAVGALAAVPLAGASIGLIAWAGRSHRTRIALWHQEDDGPVELVTWGPYRHVRHPLYAAFLLTLLACVVAAPGWVTGAALASGLLLLNRTAGREEVRLAASPLGTGYGEYMARTGRFVPRAR